MPAEAFHWNPDPILFELGPIKLRWYGLMFVSGFLIGHRILQGMYRREGKDPLAVDNLLGWMMIATVVGARLGHCLFYEPERYLGDPLAILRVWEGGLASHGGTLAILIAMIFYSRRHPDQPYLWLLDRMSVPVALTSCFIRLGNVFNSEIIGVPTDVPWAVVFERGAPPVVPRHPAQLYEALSYLGIFFLLRAMYRRAGPSSPPGRLVGLFMILIFGSRFLIEFIKERQAAFSIDMTLSMGQWLSVPAVLVGVWMLVLSRRTTSPTAAGA